MSIIGKTFTYIGATGDEYRNCTFKWGRYGNGNVALIIESDAEGQIAKCTVNTGDSISYPYIVVKDWGENEGMTEFLVSQGIVNGMTKAEIETGHVTAKVMILTEKGQKMFEEEMGESREEERGA